MNKYKVIGINGKEIIIQADDFDAQDDRVMFICGDYNIAWFKSENIIGFVKVGGRDDDEEQEILNARKGEE